MLLDDTVLPTTILLPDGSRTPYDLSGEEMREACRALRGSILRQETYALDNTDASDLLTAPPSATTRLKSCTERPEPVRSISCSSTRETID